MPATDLCHPEADRPLSVQEYRRLQQLPDNWTVCGGIIEQYRQLGNAVPTSLGLAIGVALKRHDAGERIQPPLNFPYSRYKRTDDEHWEKDSHLPINRASPKQASISSRLRKYQPSTSLLRRVADTGE